MSNLEGEVNESFAQKLREAADVADELAEQLPQLLAGEKLPKADAVISLISDHSGEQTV